MSKSKVMTPDDIVKDFKEHFKTKIKDVKIKKKGF